MLRLRSIKLQLLLLVVVVAQYDSEYRGDYETEEANDGPDYSKYYSSDASAPLTQPKAAGDNGFVSPLEFSNIFGAGSFDFASASNQDIIKSAKQQPSGFVNPQDYQAGFPSVFNADGSFGGVDYFEQSQKQQNAEDGDDKDSFEVKPGPSYVSHKIVPPAKKQNLKYGSEINDLAKDSKDYKYNSYKAPKEERDEINTNQNYEDKKVPTSFDFDFNKLPAQQSIYPLPVPIPKASLIDPKYLPQYTSNPVTPYQKYSFQPITSSAEYTPYSAPSQNFNYYDKYTTSLPNYEPSSSEYVAKLLKNKHCKKVNKEVNQKSLGDRPKREAMDCYVCKDEKSGANYEQCSYGSESSPKNYYVESTKKYIQPTVSESYRFKRYSPKHEEEEEDEKEVDPYEAIKAQTKSYYSKPEDFDSYYYKPQKTEDYKYTPEKNEEYRFGPEYFQEEDKSSSEKHSEELVKNGENCNKVNRDGMVCMVCKNSKTGGNYEQCAYSSQPDEKKYAYVKEKKYDSNDDPEEETEGTEEKPVKDKPKYGEKRKGEKGRKADDKEYEKIDGKYKKSEDYDIPKHFEESNLKNTKPRDSQRYSSSKKSEKYEEKPLESPHVDDYYYKHFPEESKKEEKKVDPEIYGYYGEGEGEKKDVETVLAEFAKKDRSLCKKAEKNGMTCYQCTDKKGLQHEECMYVSESKPESKYAAYHAKHENNEPKKEESVVKPTEVPSPKRKRFHKKTTPINPTKPATLKPVTLQSAASENIEVVANAPGTEKSSRRTYRRTKNIPATAASERVQKIKDEKEDEAQNLDLSEDGEFADETRPVYSKVYGFALPKYMLTKSEGELVYDEFVKNSQ